MIYPAIVLDNSMFLKKGTIRVRIANYYLGKMTWDLSQNTNAITEGVDTKTFRHKDFDALVFSPIGGGKNYGMFFLPQVNTKGLVAFEGNMIERGLKCFWLGSTFDPVYSEDKQNLNSINFPSDKVSANGPGEDGFYSQKSNLEESDLNGAFIMRLKSTSLEDPTNPGQSVDKINWDKRNTENLVVINKNKVLIHHADSYDEEYNEKEYQEISIEDGNVSVSSIYKNGDNTKSASFKLEKDTDKNTLGFSLSISDPENKAVNSIVATEKKLTLTTTIDQDSSVMEQSAKGITFSFNKNVVALGKDGISINADKQKVHIVASEVHLGPKNGYIVTTNFPGSFNLPNGMIIQASDTIFG